jgi:hypothetical protein
MNRWFFLAFFMLPTFLLCGQNKTGQEFFEKLSMSNGSLGSLMVIQEPGIEQLVGIHIDERKRKYGVEGFRIQLFLGSNYKAKKEAIEVKARALSLIPYEKIYIMYEAPFWRVQVGNFRSKNASLGLYRKLKKEFPSCYPVPVNNIRLSDLD